MFKSATRKVLIKTNPFVDVKGGSESNDSRKHFVSRDITEKVLEACLSEDQNRAYQAYQEQRLLATRHAVLRMT